MHRYNSDAAHLHEVKLCPAFFSHQVRANLSPGDSSHHDAQCSLVTIGNEWLLLILSLFFSADVNGGLQAIASLPVHLPACFWTMGGNWGTLTKPTQSQREHVKLLLYTCIKTVKLKCAFSNLKQNLAKEVMLFICLI